ncbi:peptide cleavage/export ABC transporter [Apilactobacillus micheneri]|uniref:peptide cleavage/export ABC transporter n=1 Tax=Apilactobacillus micheneri TaxID=1899430 RepID=UPI00112BFB5A|nr:peptide cleavage/export ABC transporter [Apilactobacillus micheneri]TPR42353.1 peptide cleavage/export ABC transporter [Apilactobacillus micheneri]TPR47074.1 peptide cleavage/export ABC transporter [Apilactobacillus micheneri]
MKIKKYYVPQVDERDCGVAALATVLKRYGSDYSLAHLRQMAKTDMEGTTALGLVRTAEKLKFDTKAIQADMALFDIENLHFPFIVQVLKNNEFYHFYVVCKANNKKITIADPDPSDGVRKISKEQFEKEWTGVALFFTPQIDYQPVKENKNSLWNYTSILFKQKRLIINIVVAALLTTIIGIAGSYYLQGMLDNFIPNQAFNTITIVSMGLIFTYIMQQILSFGQNYLLMVLGQRLSIDVILSYIKHIFKLPMSFFSTRRTGEIVSRFTDSNKIIDALANIIMSMFLDTFIVIILAIVLAAQSMTLFFLTLLLIPLYTSIIYIFVKPFEKYNQEVMESNAKLSSSIIEDINGIETIKSLNAEQNSYNRVDHEFVKYLKKSFTYSKLDLTQQAIKTGIQLIMNVVILWVGARLVMNNVLSIGQLMTYNALLSYFTNPIQNIINLQTKLQSARVANNRLNEVYLVESEFKKKRPIKDISSINGDIEFKNVQYNYGYSAPVLQNLDLKINKKQKIVLVGMSGSGKTTLAQLLAGFYPVHQGDITVNNKSIENIDRHVLRSYINYIPQTPYLFNGTILENLTLGCKPGITMQDIQEACQMAEINQDIENKPLQYQTELSENGTILSGGQKQRLTIARALLSPAQVLIFDESTSALDTITEDKIINNLLSLTNKTIIFVAHRLNIAKKVDKIVLLDKGKIVDQGSHKELLQNSNFYSELFNK